MEFHIGKIIKMVAKEKRIGPTELGNKINTSKQNIYGIFRRQSVDTKLLVKLSMALDHDFFMEYVRYLGLSSNTPYTKGPGMGSEDASQMQLEIDYLKNANQDLRKANDDLRDMVKLLRERLNNYEGKE